MVTRWTMRGTHRGEFRGIAPSGNRIMVTGIGIFRFSDEGKVVESWDNFDQLGMMRQLGVIPSPERSAQQTPTAQQSRGEPSDVLPANTEEDLPPRTDEVPPTSPGAL